MKSLLNYFLRGMLIVFPLGATLYLVMLSIEWINSVSNNLLFGWIDYEIPGIGIITGFLLITLVGFIFTLTFTKPIVHFFEQLLSKTPLVSIIYTSLKDLTEAFVGEKKKFNQPVKVEFGSSGLIRFGFITQEDLSNFDLVDSIAIYCPHSYNFSGNLYIVPKANVTVLDVDPASFMRFIVSGGVTGITN